MLRQHTLMALGKIRDPASARRILDYARSESNSELRATAIHTIGEIGDESVRDELKTWNETEKDPALQAQLREALAKLAPQRAGGSFRLRRGHNHVFSFGVHSRSFGTFSLSPLTFPRGLS